mgnify:CR=1 FL=1
MNYFKVELDSRSLANEDQIVDGCLGNSFRDGKVALYTRGEALKKAMTLLGKIKLVTSTNTIFVQMITREGELSNTIKTVHEIPDAVDIDGFADMLAKEYYSDENVEDTGSEWLHNSGCIATSILKVETIDYDDYLVLKKYL